MNRRPYFAVWTRSHAYAVPAHVLDVWTDHCSSYRTGYAGPFDTETEAIVVARQNLKGDDDETTERSA